MYNEIEKSFNTAFLILQKFIEDKENIKLVALISEKLAEAYKSGNKSIIAGNGGSSCDAMHFSQEFTGRFRKDRPALPSISLSDSSHITCVGNDCGFEDIFARGIEAFGKKNDLFFALSTSGNSENILRAIHASRRLGLVTIGLTGKDGGKMKGLCDYEFIIPGDTSDRIQELHMLILHIIIEGTERILFPQNYLQTEK